jgi:hypothetical protein
MNLHEDYRAHTAEKQASDRSFGWVFTVFFALYACLPLRHGGTVRFWAVAASGVFLLTTLVRPSLLHFANLLWGNVGRLLGRVVNPVVTALLFYVVVTPTGLLMRMTGKDVLRLRWAPEDKSYWIDRQPPGPDPRTMSNQF